MSLDGPLAAAAAYEKRLHTATCTITRPDPDGTPNVDPNTGAHTDPPPIAVYSGACALVPIGGDQVQEFGEGPVPLRSYYLEVADLSVEFEVGDDVTIDTSRDPQAVEMTLQVLDIPKSEVVTTRRLTVEEVL